MRSLFEEQDPIEDRSDDGSDVRVDLSSLNLSEDHAPRSDSFPKADEYQSPEFPMTFAETVRGSGLAYAAAISLVASVVFMLLLGWFIDLLAGTKPYGVVAGIVLGAVIGFVQFFRLTSQIFKK